MARTHHLDASTVHYEWNNALAPRLVVEPGDTVVFDTRDAADGYYSVASTHADVLARGPFRGHPLTGPVAVAGARPGDTLVVEILEVKPRAPFGWTAIRPGRGLLPEADFPKPFLRQLLRAYCQYSNPVLCLRQVGQLYCSFLWHQRQSDWCCNLDINRSPEEQWLQQAVLP